jgi:putative ABC transport system ATP-binding protein
MIISLQHFLPLPLRDLKSGLSDFWQSERMVFESGKKYLLYASSGKGKTTLLSSIYGIRKDFEGDILIDNENIRDYHSRKWPELRKGKLSYIFQGLELFDNLTAMENIQLKNAQTKFKTHEEILAMASALEMESFLDKKVGILSYGQKQRLAIIRALCQDFKFLLADEIFSHLDIDIAKKAFEIIIRECANRNAGLLFTSLSQNSKFEFDQKFQL